MTIDADLLAYYDQMARKYPEPADAAAPSPQAVRARFATVATEALRPLPAGLRSETFVIPLPGRDLRARLYRPVTGEVPLVVYFHGGGWVVGDVDTHGTLAAFLAQDGEVTEVAPADADLLERARVIRTDAGEDLDLSLLQAKAIAGQFVLEQPATVAALDALARWCMGI